MRIEEEKLEKRVAEQRVRMQQEYMEEHKKQKRGKVRCSSEECFPSPSSQLRGSPHIGLAVENLCFLLSADSPGNPN